MRAFIVEVQLAPDQDKVFTWPMYAAGLGARERCPVTLVVLTLEHIARAAIVACAALDSRHRALYADFVVACLGPEARRALEVLMPLQQFVPLSDIGKQIYAEGQRDGLRGLLIKQLVRRFGPLLP